ncbi:MAG: aquaporin [Caulobacteraceae bacterium]|nr:aquaporin [Caulobacteraceae bacterium]
MLGTALLLAIVIGSGVVGERLSGGNVATALLGNTLATGAGLIVLIAILGPLSGAHFNPAVTLAFALRHQKTWRGAVAYILAQLAGAVAANILFGWLCKERRGLISTPPLRSGGDAARSLAGRRRGRPAAAPTLAAYHRALSSVVELKTAPDPPRSPPIDTGDRDCNKSAQKLSHNRHKLIL